MYPYIIAGLWLAALLIIVKTWRPLRVRKEDPFKLANSGYDLDWICGIAHGAQAYTSTSTTHRTNATTQSAPTFIPGSGPFIMPGSSTQVSTSVSTQSTLHKEFFVRRPNGKDCPFKLRDWDVPIAEGQPVSCVYFRKKNADRIDSGPGTVVILNHASDVNYTRMSLLRTHIRPTAAPAWLVALSILVAVIWGVTSEKGDNQTRSRAMNLVFLALVFVVVFSVLRKLYTWYFAKRFHKHDRVRIVTAVNGHAEVRNLLAPAAT